MVCFQLKSSNHDCMFACREPTLIKRAVIIAIGSPYHRSVLTYSRAHAMLPALGKPLVARIMDRLYCTGIREFSILVGESEGAVAGYLNTQWVPDAAIDFLLKSPSESLVTMLAQLARTHSTPMLICGYNSFTHNHLPESLLKNHEDSPTELLLSGATHTLSKASQHYYAISDGQGVRDVTKTLPNDHNAFYLADIAVAGSAFIDYLKTISSVPPGGFNWQFMDIIREYITNGGKAILTETSWILPIETDRDLLTLNKHLLNEGNDAHLLSEIPYTVQIIPPVRIDPQVSVGQGTRIGPNVYLERGCSIGHDVTLRNAIVLEKAVVPAQKSVFDTIISTRGPIP